LMPTTRCRWSLPACCLSPLTRASRPGRISTGFPILGRPVVNALDGTQSAYLDSVPGLAAGTLAIEARVPVVRLGGQCALSRLRDAPAPRGCPCRGFAIWRCARPCRSRIKLSPLPPIWSSLKGCPWQRRPRSESWTSFRTTNQFGGLQVGGRLGWDGDFCFLSMFGKFALGGNQPGRRDRWSDHAGHPHASRGGPGRHPGPAVQHRPVFPGRVQHGPRMRSSTSGSM